MNSMFRIQLLCLNGGEKFASIVSNARSTVLIGGTMRPTDLITSLLTKDCGIERTRIIDNSYDHIIDATNLRIVSIGKLSIVLKYINFFFRKRFYWAINIYTYNVKR